MLNRHGLKLAGIKAASGTTKNERPYSDWHYMVFYNTETDEVWTLETYGQNNWYVYEHNPEIIRIADTRSHYTMQEIADLIDRILCLRGIREQ